MAEIFALDYNSEKVETGIYESDVKSIKVTVISGDEILEIEPKDGGGIYRFDSGAGTRVIDYYDGEYDISPEDEDFQKWMNRKDSYEFCFGYHLDEEDEQDG